MRTLRHRLGIRPVYKTVDTCAAEFAARTPYHYSAYETDPAAESEIAPQTEKPKVLILGSGPNRIGQGIEFDYSCVHAVMALREAGFETVMVNCNPETVSTDYDTADRLYFEPLTFEDVLEVVHAEQESGTVAGVIVQLGGQTPLGLAAPAHRRRACRSSARPRRRSTWPRTAARSARCCARRACRRRRSAWRPRSTRRREIAARIGYPVLVRPVLRARRARHGDRLRRRRRWPATSPAPPRSARTGPVLVDRFLDDAVEIDVDALCDGSEVFLGGVMEHIEEAGVHSGDSSLHAAADHARPLGAGAGAPLHRGDRARGRRARAAQRAVRAARRRRSTCWRPTRGRRARCRSCPRRRRCRWPRRRPGSCSARRSRSCAPRGCCPPTATAASCRPDAPIAVKEAVLPFHRFRTRDGQGVDPLLGPEMKSTGEVMGFDASFGRGVRQVAGRGVRVAADVGAGVRLDRRPRQAGDGVPGAAAGRPRLRGAGHRGHRGGAAPPRASRRHGGAQALRGRAGEPRR